MGGVVILVAAGYPLSYNVTPFCGNFFKIRFRVSNLKTMTRATRTAVKNEGHGVNRHISLRTQQQSAVTVTSQ